MAGVIVQLIVSWLLVWLIEKKNLSVLGLSPSSKRFSNFIFGLAAAALCCSAYYILTALSSKTNLSLNEKFNAGSLSYASWWILKSVLFEELLFRGVLLYLAIQKLGLKTACILSAVAFGCYHWFSYGVLGNPVQMIFIFILTGIAGLMFAFSYALTRSLYLPIGLHFGWNFVTIVIFSQGPLGDQLVLYSNNSQPGLFISIMLFLLQAFILPIIVYFYLKKNLNR